MSETLISGDWFTGSYEVKVLHIQALQPSAQSRPTDCHSSMIWQDFAGFGSRKGSASAYLWLFANRKSKAYIYIYPHRTPTHQSETTMNNPTQAHRCMHVRTLSNRTVFCSGPVAGGNEARQNKIDQILNALGTVQSTALHSELQRLVFISPWCLD